MQRSAPGLSAAEVAKFTTTRAGRDALKGGVTALARVDSHLQAVTGERNSVIGRKYGVFGENPTTFGGVYRALGQSITENERISALPDDPAHELERRLLFTPLVAFEVSAAYQQLVAILGARITTRAELSRDFAVNAEFVDEALAAISAVRNHLYANLPLRNRDPVSATMVFDPSARRDAATREAAGTVDPESRKAGRARQPERRLGRPEFSRPRTAHRSSPKTRAARRSMALSVPSASPAAR